MIRGGSWNNNARNVRAAYRNWNKPGNRNNNLGFRCSQLDGGLDDPRWNRALSRPHFCGEQQLTPGV